MEGELEHELRCTSLSTFNKLYELDGQRSPHLSCIPKVWADQSKVKSATCCGVAHVSGGPTDQAQKLISVICLQSAGKNHQTKTENA